MVAVRNTQLERPLTARSVISSLLLGMRPPRMRAALLVRWCAAFGIAEGTARVAMSRMVERGELRLDDGVYELAGRLRDRQPAQDWSLTPKLGRWTGDWRMGVVMGVARPAAERTALREAMRRLRYAELREGLWARPDNLPRASGPDEAWAVADAQCAWWAGRPDPGSEDDPLETVASRFGADGWATRASVWCGRLDDVTRALDAPSDDDLAAAFVAGAGALAHVRHDPLLPEALCPSPWPGADLRAAYATYQRAFSEAVRTFFRRP